MNSGRDSISYMSEAIMSVLVTTISTTEIDLHRANTIISASPRGSWLAEIIISAEEKTAVMPSSLFVDRQLISVSSR